MNISEALGRFLRSNSAISVKTSEVRPVLLPDDAQYPAITYAMTYDEPIDILDDSKSELWTAGFSVNNYADNYGVCRDLSDTVRKQLDSTKTLSDITVRRIDCTLDLDRYETQSKIYSAAQIYTIWYYQEG